MEGHHPTNLPMAVVSHRATCMLRTTRAEVPEFREVRPGRFAACHLVKMGVLRWLKTAEVKNATKVFGLKHKGAKLVAVDDVSFDIEAKAVILSIVKSARKSTPAG